MKKIAIFAEGQTEQLLSEEIVKCVAGERKIKIIKVDAKGGGKKSNPRVIEIKAESNSAEYYVLIVNCGADNRVKSDILDRHQMLMASGYETVIGIRDVYPFVKRDELPKLRSGLSNGLPVGLPKVLFVLAVMELEAWILAEHTHFPKMHPSITVDLINQKFGINVVDGDLTRREKPSKDLSDIYWLETIEYNKSREFIEKILSVLDQMHLKNVVSKRFEDLLAFYNVLENFFQQ